jgi:uncharacterized membrane protein
VALDRRTRSQRWADAVTMFSGSWAFIAWFAIICTVWIVVNVTGIFKFDVYPFMFLNWVLTIISTFQNPLIMLSQNRQNENDKEESGEILSRLAELQRTVDELKRRIG